LLAIKDLLVFMEMPTYQWTYTL